MYTKRLFSLRQLLLWTRYELILLVIMAAVPAVAYDVFGLRWLHLPWLPVALVGTAVAFLLSFQNNAAYDRTWEARKIWGGIVNSSRAFGFAVNDFVTNEFAKEPATEEELDRIRRRLVHRHVAWLTSLRYALRAPRPWEHPHGERTNREWNARIRVQEHHHDLESEIGPYVPEDEGPLVCGTANPAIQLLAQQSRNLRELHLRGLIDDFRHVEFQTLLRQLADGQGKSERIKNFPYPRQYATLNATFLWIFIVLIPLGLVNEFADASARLEDERAWMGSAFVWASVPFSTVVMWIFHTMERIGRVTENPFEGSVNDVPITTMARGIEIDLRQMIGEEPGSIPPPIEVRQHTQT